MAAGADFHARDKDGSTPLQRSFGKGIAVLRELLGGNRANKADSEGRAPLSLLVAAGMSQEHLDTALAAGADPDTRDMYSKTALHVAIARNDYISPARLIQAGADLFAPDSEMKTPAELVLEAGSVAIRAIVEATVKAGLGGASVADALGNTLLHYAARQGKAEAIKVLLELGAERTAKNAMDETAYDIAVKQGQRTAAELLAGK
jgi:ankyrin repeat protein